MDVIGLRHAITALGSAMRVLNINKLTESRSRWKEPADWKRSYELTIQHRSPICVSLTFLV
jgi:hypothetical protein